MSCPRGIIDTKHLNWGAAAPRAKVYVSALNGSFGGGVGPADKHPAGNPIKLAAGEAIQLSKRDLIAVGRRPQ